MKKSFILILLIILILGINIVSATENNNITDVQDISPLEINDGVKLEDGILDSSSLHNIQSDENTDSNLSSDDESNDVIVVNDWGELQYYCSLTDKDYTLKLKENTNYYPTDTMDSNYQIKINNNVKIIGSNGSYLGDSYPSHHLIFNGSKVISGKYISYTPIVVPDGNQMDLTLENITFKWICTYYGPDAVFIQMGGDGNYLIKNCIFNDINTNLGHSCLAWLKKGDALIENCTFVNCTTDFGCLSVYNKNSYDNARMVVKDCYFENNYARTEPGCINNCAVLTVYNTTFYKNRASVWAGAIHTHFYAVANIYDSTFIDNIAGWNGGALYTYGDLNIYNTSFIGNNCTTNNGGGAIGACKYQSAPHIYIENSLFEKNANNCWGLDELSTDGTGRGGAISLMDEGSLEVRNSVFIANAASIGTAICAVEAGSYGSPDVIIVNNTFINHTRVGDVLNVRVKGTICNISDNYYFGNSIEFSVLTLKTLSQGKDQATLQVTAKLSNPSYYDSDILEKTCYDVYVNDVYVKTVNSTKFSVDFGDLDICNVYVVPTISNRKSNEVTVTSTREYVFVSQNRGNDNNNGLTRNTPVKSIQKALELAVNCKNIILLDGLYDEANLNIPYDLTLKGENDATLTGSTSFLINHNFTLKNIKISNLNGDVFIKEVNSNLIIENCIFKDNNVRIIEGDSITVSRSVFINNDDLIIMNNGFACIKDSIILNNSDVIQGSSNYALDYNWWGNTLENQIEPFNGISNWLILKGISNTDKLENSHTTNVEFNFYLNDTKYLNLPKINLKLNPFNGITNINSTPLNSKVMFTLTAFDDAVLTASYYNINTALSFEFLKSNPGITIQTGDVMFGEDVIVQITVPRDANGNLTVTLGNVTQTKEITNQNMIFVFTNSSANRYGLQINYSGDRKYSSQVKNAHVNVNRYVSNVEISLSEIEVEKDLTITITTDSDATGNISLYINGKLETLTLTDAKANYTIKNITRGDYRITAVYNGDEKYLKSSDYRFIEVDNIESAMDIKVDNITYGESAIINVYLNDNATGNVTVTVDGMSNTSKVNNGQAKITLANLDAGINKNVTVFYTGDDTYFNKTQTAVFTIAKTNLTFAISSRDIKIGQDAVIKIKVPPKTTGTFTIANDTIIIPISGDIEYVISNLEIGEYTVTAVYDGNNYFTVSNSTEFKVSEYPRPQWANSGADTQNTGKSTYDSQTNGEIAFIIQIDDEIIGDLTIDSSGNIYITTKDLIYSYNSEGILNYVFTPDTRESSFSGTCIGRDVIITPKSGDTLYFINQSSGERYGSANLYQGSSVHAPVIDSNANIYIVSEYQTRTGTYNLVKIPYKLWEGGGNPILIDLGK